MNKVTNRRALAVYLVICLLYVSVAFRIPEKLSMKRISVRDSGPSHGMDIREPNEPDKAQAESGKVMTEIPVTSAPHIEPASAALVVAPVATLPTFENSSSTLVNGKGNSKVEPRFFMSIPITCYAIKEGWLDREALIFSRKDGQNNIWLKPLDILKQHDEDSVKSLVTIIGKSRLKEFLKREAADIKAELSPEDIMLGRGYMIEKKKLLSLYDRFVSDEWNDLFPLVIGQGGVVKGREGFKFVSSAEAAKVRIEKEDEEWRMPNLSGLPIKLAIDNLAAHTARIKVHGGGLVVDQFPKPFERLKGDSECAIYGRLASE
jgi:hypothetical protein